MKDARGPNCPVNDDPEKMAMNDRPPRSFRRSGAALALLALALPLAGCSDPKAASDDNFKSALQGWFDTNPVCTTLVAMGKVPIVREVPNHVDEAKLDLAVNAGLLSVESFREVPRFATKPADFRRYTPTDTGKDAIRANDTGLGGVQLCFARRNVVEVVNWTEPGDVMGLRATQVRYRYRLDDIAPWTQTADMRAAFPQLAKALDTPEGEDKASLILTNEGWAHERSLRK